MNILTNLCREISDCWARLPILSCSWTIAIPCGPTSHYFLFRLQNNIKCVQTLLDKVLFERWPLQHCQTSIGLGLLYHVFPSQSDSLCMMRQMIQCYLQLQIPLTSVSLLEHQIFLLHCVVV